VILDTAHRLGTQIGIFLATHWACSSLHPVDPDRLLLINVA